MSYISSWIPLICGSKATRLTMTSWHSKETVGTSQINRFAWKYDWDLSRAAGWARWLSKDGFIKWKSGRIKIPSQRYYNLSSLFEGLRTIGKTEQEFFPIGNFDWDAVTQVRQSDNLR